MPGQFAPSPRNPTPRRVGSKVSPAGRLSDPRQIVARTMYRIPPRTSNAPSPIRIISTSQLPRTRGGSSADSFLCSELTPPRQVRGRTQYGLNAFGAPKVRNGATRKEHRAPPATPAATVKFPDGRESVYSIGTIGAPSPAAGSWGMTEQICIIPHSPEGIPETGSFEVVWPMGCGRSEEGQASKRF
jgi:hypothetical protein